MEINSLRLQRILSILLVLLVGGITYINALTSGFLCLDDRSLLIGIQSTEHSFSNIFAGGHEYYRPLSIALLIFDYYLFGTNSAGYHLVNVLLHLSNGLLVYYLSIEYMEERADNNKIALLSALLFILHPIVTEPVVWISARTDLLCCFFFLLSLILVAKKRDNFSLFQFSTLYAAALASLCAKEASISLLLIAPLYCLLRKGKISIKWAMALNTSIYLAAVTYFFMRSGKTGSVDKGVSQLVVNAAGSPSATIIDSVTALGFYIGKLLYPFPLNFAINDVSRTQSIAFLLLFAAIAITLAYCSEYYRIVLLITLTCLFPPILAFLGKFPWALYAERYLYLPLTGFAIFAALFIRDYFKRFSYGVHLSLVLLLAFPTVQRVILWGNQVAFWEDAVRKSPNFARTYVSLGIANVDQGMYAEAERNFNKALSMGFNKDIVWMNLANIYYARKEYEKYENAVINGAELSGNASTLYTDLAANLMNAYNKSADKRVGYNKAIKYYIKAYEKDPVNSEGLYNAGKLLWVMGDNKHAEECFKSFLAQKNNSPFKPFAIKILMKIQNS